MSAGDSAVLGNDPLWYKDAIIYEVPVKSYGDGYGDGQGDFRGLTEKLDYIQDLGVTAIWLLPFYPSPLRDDGYDISDYQEVHPNYGTLADFKELLSQAHRRGLRVITELVINHTSDRHPWFQRARRSPPGSVERDFYVWSDTPDKFRDARIIFKDFETSNWAWDPIARAYYWHRFYSHQPDLNYDNPAVWNAIIPLIDYWMEMGVDGMRLDAIPYLYEREGTTCENLPETHMFLKALRKHVDEKFPGRMFLAEANQWPEDAVAYFGDGDECHTAFHFPLMPRMFMALRTEDRFPIIDILAQTPPIPDNCQWCLFLRNHDELTLEMVTDEERDYMYRAYASDPQARINLGIRRRLAPLLGNNRRRIELLNGLLFSLPGTPVLYYGDEIGMGDNIYLGDRNGVRTPMQWSGDRNAGFSRANPQKLYLPIITDPEYHYESVNVEAQQNNPNSLLWWMKRLIDLRKRYRAFGRGSLQFLYPDNPKILAFIRRYEDEVLLVVANLARFTQHMELDLSEFAGKVPLELFGRSEFPVIGKEPYFMMLGPHGFAWFAIQPVRPAVLGMTTLPTGTFPEITVRGSWERVFKGVHKDALEEILPQFLVQRRWFGGKNRQVRTVTVREVIPIPHDGTTTCIALLGVEYLESEPEMYVLPLSFATGQEATHVVEHRSHAVVARLSGGDDNGVLYDGVWNPNFCSALLRAISQNEVIVGSEGKLHALPFVNLTEETKDTVLTPTLNTGEQSNTSILYSDRYVLKIFRQVEEGINPDLEIGRYLTEKRSFPHTPATIGCLDYRKRRTSSIVLGLLQRYAANEGTAWQYTLTALSQFFERVLTTPNGHAPSAKPLLELATTSPPTEVVETIGAYLEAARLLGQRTREMHQALASETEDENFTPEPFTPIYQRSVYQSMRTAATHAFQALSKRMKKLPEEIRPLAQQVLELQPQVLSRFQKVVATRITENRIRYHGDFHLGQVLYTGKDFVLIDFKGEPLRSLNDRRLKRSALRDVASMLRSFHYAAYTALLGRTSGRSEGQSHVRSADFARLEPWARFWHAWVGATYLKAYREGAEGAVFFPASDSEFQILLEAFVLSKAVTELNYELVSRPEWVTVPLLGILELLAAPE